MALSKFAFRRPEDNFFPNHYFKSSVKNTQFEDSEVK